ncbi:phage baseplate assembly protein W, partial [Rhodoblastus acidophilus]|nr:phage baseplate assembly protein W [Rhodoblastus acidophilus]
MSAGIDKRTGRPLEGWPHVVQSLGTIFTTGFGARVMRRVFGSAVAGILGQNLTPDTT